MKANNELKIESKEFVKVYYEYDPSRKNPFRLFEREGFFDAWRIVDDYKTLDEAQESGRSRAIRVVDMGLFERGHRKGMMGWWDEPKTAPKALIEMAVLPPSNEVEYDSKLRKVPKPSSRPSSRPSSKPSSKRSSLIDDADIEEAIARIALAPVSGDAILEMDEEIALKRNAKIELRK